MSDKFERQTTDSEQGGEGTNSFHQKSYDALTTPFPQGNTARPEPADDQLTK